MIDLSGPKTQIEVVDTLVVKAKCNDCKSGNIAVTIERHPIEEDNLE